MSNINCLVVRAQPAHNQAARITTLREWRAMSAHVPLRLEKLPRVVVKDTGPAHGGVIPHRNHIVFSEIALNGAATKTLSQRVIQTCLCIKHLAESLC